MQNRLDELFQAAREEQPFYTYPEAEMLVKSFPAGGFTFPKIPTMILGTILITGASFWLLQEAEPKEFKVKESMHFVNSGPATDSFTGIPASKTIKPFQVHKPEGSILPADTDTENAFFAGISGGTPKYELIEKQKKEEEYLVLDPENLAKLGIVYNQNTSLHYEFKNGRKKNLYKMHIEFEGSGYNVESSRTDTLRYVDYLCDKPFPVLFIRSYPEYGGADPIRCIDPSIPVYFKKQAFEHLNEQLIPVLVNVKASYGDLKYIFYFAPNDKFYSALPAGTDKNWLYKPVFDWDEYERYREMLWQRQKDYYDEILLKVKQRLSSDGAQCSNAAELKKLGIDYNGKSLRTVLTIISNGKRLGRSSVILSGGGMSFLQNDPPEPALKFPQPYLYSDSSFRTMMLIVIPDDSYALSFEKRKELNNLALSMIDTLVPVVVPLGSTLKEKILYRKKLYGPKNKHIIFWYRKQDLDAVGFRFDN